MGGQTLQGTAPDPSATDGQWLFVASTILVPILVALVPFMIRWRYSKNWTAAADIFIFLTGLEFSILMNIDSIGKVVPSVFSKQFNSTIAVLLALSFVVMVLSIFVEEDIAKYELRIKCPARQVQQELADAVFPIKRVFCLWVFALALMSLNLYIVVGSALGIGG